MSNPSSSVVIASASVDKLERTRTILRGILVTSGSRKAFFCKWGARIARALIISLTIGYLADLVIETSIELYRYLNDISQSDFSEVSVAISDPDVLSDLLLNPENFDQIIQHPDVLTELLSIPEIFAEVSMDAEAFAEVVAEPEIFSSIAAREEIFSALISESEVIAELATEAETFNMLMRQPEVIAYLSRNPESTLAILSNEAARVALTEQPQQFAQLMDCLDATRMASAVAA